MLTFCADQRVHERRLADVRPADDRDVAAAECRRSRSGIATRRRPRLRARSAGARRPPAPPRAGWCRGPRRDDAERGNAAFDVEHLRVRLAGRRDHRVLRHRQPPRLQPLLQPRLRDPCRAPPDRRARARRRSSVHDRPRARRRSRRRGTPRRTPLRARRRGSTARSAPPLFCSPSPSLISRPARAPRATRASVSWLTSAARTRDRSPSGSARKALDTARRATTQLSTASPTNSSRSLCEAP